MRLKRIAEQDLVLCVQDDTELDLTRPNQQVHELGPIGSSNSSKRGRVYYLFVKGDGQRKTLKTHLLGIEAEQSLESQGSSCNFRIHMSGYALPFDYIQPLPNTHAQTAQNNAQLFLRTK